jgi:hypothetical protein
MFRHSGPAYTRILSDFGIWNCPEIKFAPPQKGKIENPYVFIKSLTIWQVAYNDLIRQPSDKAKNIFSDIHNLVTITTASWLELATGMRHKGELLLFFIPWLLWCRQLSHRYFCTAGYGGPSLDPISYPSVENTPFHARTKTVRGIFIWIKIEQVIFAGRLANGHMSRFWREVTHSHAKWHLSHGFSKYAANDFSSKSGIRKFFGSNWPLSKCGGV